MNKIKIVLADDHKLFREGVRSLLEKYNNFEVVGEAENGRMLVELVGTLNPDVILADITMPEMSGLDALLEIRKKKVPVKIIILTMHEDGKYITRAVQEGADGYLFKNVDEDELIKSINKVISGDKAFDSKVSALMIDAISKGAGEFGINLTNREKEILQLVADGLSTKMIADKLFLSSRTVETHRVNIMKKLGAQNTADLVKKAIELDLIL